MVERKTLGEVGDAFDGDLLGADPIGTAEDAAATALAAVAEQLPIGGTVNLSYGDEDIAEYIRQLTADHLIHGWDLAAATGQDRVLDAEVVAEVAAWFAEREDLYRGAGMIAERPAAPVGDPQADLLLASVGNRIGRRAGSAAASRARQLHETTGVHETPEQSARR